MRVQQIELAATPPVASMRPGQAAPDEVPRPGGDGPDRLASMRPGQAAPDEACRYHRRGVAALPASMRPGQAAPDEAWQAWPSQWNVWWLQ